MASPLRMPSVPPLSTWPGGPSLPQAVSDPRRSSVHFVTAPSSSAASSAIPTIAAAISQCAPATPHFVHPARPVDLNVNAQIRSHEPPAPSHINHLPTSPAPSPQYTPAQMVVPSRNFIPPGIYQAPVPLDDSSLQSVDDTQSTAVPSHAPGGRSREKRHACSMCHKAFDRPSTLRKHLLVHTGEKAFACDTCGRRFGVLSNLNRHIRRCALRTDTGTEGGSNSPEASDTLDGSPESHQPDARPSSTATTISGDEPVADAPAIVSLTDGAAASASTPPARRGRAASATVDAAGSGGASRKRRSRRAPSPSTWVPASLQAFDLTPTKDSCLLPLAPVLPYQNGAVWEERDSYEGDASERPYHPSGWRGKLPGPGGLRSMISSGMSTMGRLVFS